MYDLSASEIDQVAQFFVVRSMRIGKRNDGSSESVVIRYNMTDESCVDFALKVEEECWKQGAHTLLRPISYVRERVKLSKKPEGALREIEPLVLRLAETMDVNMYIGDYDDVAPSDPNSVLKTFRWVCSRCSAEREETREVMIPTSRARLIGRILEMRDD